MTAVSKANTDRLRSFRARSEPNQSQMPIRILFVATSTGQGGIERHSVRLAEELIRNGARLSYACRPGTFLHELCAEREVATQSLSVRNSGDLRAAWSLAGMIVQGRIDIVHVHSRRDFVIAVLAAACAKLRLRGTGACPRLVLHAHLLTGLGRPGRLGGAFFERGADAVVAVSCAAQRKVIDLHKLDPARVTVIPNGIDVDAYHFSPSRWRSARKCLRQCWGIPQDALVVGMIGRLNAKGQSDLLRVAPQILTRFPVAHFVFVGPEGAEGDRLDLQELAAGGGVEAQVSFTGSLENIPEVLAAFDVLAHLPAIESFGLTLVEALAASCPVIATDIGGCAEVIEHAVTGLLVSPQDESGLVEAVTHLLAIDSREAAWTMSEAGLRLAHEKFPLKRQAANLQNLYAALLNRERSRH